MKGGLPEGWATCPVREHFRSFSGGTPDKGTPGYWGGNIPWLSSGDIKASRIRESSELITKKGLDASSAKLCRPGSIVIVVRSGILKHTLPIAVLEREASINQDIKCFDSGNDEFNEWLALALQFAARDILALNREGTTVQSVKYETLKDFELRVPPLAEQRRIVAKVEGLLAKVRSAQDRLDKIPTLLKRFRQSVLAAACSGRLTADWRSQQESGSAKQIRDSPEDAPFEVPSDWRWQRNAELAMPKNGAICAGPFGTIFKARDFRDSGVPIIFLRHVAEGKYLTTKPGFMNREKWTELFQPYSVYGGELLVTKLGDPPGTCAVYPRGIGPAMVTPDVIKMEANEGLAKAHYLMYFFNSAISREIMFGLAFGVTRLRIDLPMFKRLWVPVPPIAEQEEIVRRVESMLALADRLQARYEKARVQVDKLTQSILAKAFRGELVPTEASLARLANRPYESATQLLARLRSQSVTVVGGRRGAGFGSGAGEKLHRSRGA